MTKLSINKFTIILYFKLLFMVGFGFIFFSSVAIASEMPTKAKEAYIIDFETGQVLLEKAANQKMPTSSMSKVMTTIMVFDALKAGRISPSTEFKISEKASKKGGSKMFIAQGSDVSVEDLLRGIIIQSGNDATIAVAEGLYGDEDIFSEKMNARAKEIGMTNSNFVNASGWPDDNHYSTAKDLAVMSKFLIENYPEEYKMFAEEEFEFSGIKQSNRNPLLNNKFKSDGIKTGHTEAAGYGLIGSATKDNRRVIMVLNGIESMSERAAESQRLMQWALNNFKNVSLLSSGKNIAQAPVAMGKEDTVALIAKDEIKATIAQSIRPEDVKMNAGFNAPLIAPIQKGDQVGALLIQIPNQDDIKIPLYAAENVERAGFFKRYGAKFKHIFLNAI